MGDFSKTMLKIYSDYSAPQKFGMKCLVHYPEGSYPLHRHDYFEIEYIAQGEMTHEVNGVYEHLKQGSCYVLGPDDLHRFTVEKPIEIHNLCISYKDAPPAIQKLISKVQLPQTARIPENSMREIDEWFFRIKSCIENNCSYDSEKITAFTLLFLTSIFDLSKPLAGQKTAGGYRYISKALDYIDKNYAQPITLNDIAAFVNLTPNYFSRLFHEICGCTFLTYFINQRIEKAKYMLTNSNRSITEIAFACGFGSFSSFSRSFKTICGCRPNDFRKYAGGLPYGG